ncbi:MAG: preprotein translocase subunit SecE [Clostridiales bacterium]|nr:preprotein translocase subunit SecE [Clostridiales bacterium]
MEEKDKKTLSKRTAAAAAASAEQKKKGGLKAYFKGVKTEMKKVVWPTKKELLSYTVVVVATCAVFALLFWGFDTGFLALLKLALNITL